MIITETGLTVRYAETDQMGIVHHSNYPIWFEAGRTDFIKKLGMPYWKMEEDGILLPVIELKCSYKGAAKYGDEVVVRTSIKEFTYTRLVLYYEVSRRGEQSPITTGETMHVWTNRELKPFNLKKHSPRIYQVLEEAAKQ